MLRIASADVSRCPRVWPTAVAGVDLPVIGRASGGRIIRAFAPLADIDGRLEECREFIRAAVSFAFQSGTAVAGGVVHLASHRRGALLRWNSRGRTQGMCARVLERASQNAIRRISLARGSRLQWGAEWTRSHARALSAVP